MIPRKVKLKKLLFFNLHPRICLLDLEREVQRCERETAIGRLEPPAQVRALTRNQSRKPLGLRDDTPTN